MLTSRRGSSRDPLRSERSCVLARRGMVCASVPAAAAAGVEILRRGGNAVDAAIATAAVLCVVEPMSTGIGGDAFALVWSARERRLLGLNGSGRAPAAASVEAYRVRGLERIAPRGILAATVPGTVHAWETLSQRLGALPLAIVLEPAIRAAEEGFPVTELVAHYWSLLAVTGALHNEDARRSWLPGGVPPAVGSWFRAPDLGRTLRDVAEGGAAGFYRGRAAGAIVETSQREGGFFTPEDLAEHTSTWVDPIATTYRGTEVVELPPNGQGIAALIALNILETLDPSEATAGSALDWHRRIEATKLAFADRSAYVADPDRVHVPVKPLLDKHYARRRAAALGERALPGAEPGLAAGDTVYLCTADEQGNMVSFIQSLFTGFGSGVGCGDSGVVLQSRGAGFVLDPEHPNALAGGKRPFHTIIPGMLMRGGEPWMAFGIMGGDVQPQAHTAFVSNLIDHGCNPQEALDRPRFRYLEGNRVVVETPDAAVDEGGTLGDALAARGHEVVDPGAAMADVFGGGQAVAALDDGVWAGASDRRKDGCALGLWDAPTPKA
ncbi:MAG TPA: gamma-glutamyltransferase family protein [Polyangia bacterium]|nr:gamma-glutamyltransferase family protein [Polyangia bacterium]